MATSTTSTPQQTTNSACEPPFQLSDSIFSSAASNATVTSSNAQGKLPLVLPAAYFVENQTQTKVLTAINNADSETFKTFVRHDLNVERLNNIYEYLFIAGTPACAANLHEQIVIGRSFIVTEQADLHLVWHESTIYLKPLPEYLLDFNIWEDVICKDRKLVQEANGMLLSYMWLVCSKSDLKLAHETGLLSTAITWDRWTAFSTIVLQKLDYHTMRNISPRYLYGELRLGRLNLIYRIRSPFHNPLMANPTWGFHYHRRQYKETLRNSFNQLITATVYVTVVLTAMQVGLGTDHLRDNGAFNQVSYGFTVFAIIAPLALLFIILVVQLAHFIWKLINALALRQKKEQKLQRVSTT